ncbi:hypothetical protein GCM10009785_16150 [Brooklawnia cerclae]|uniref:DNA-binding MarR family transcriptional regulator n=1 Tax=Brooklawnia cerclae TaxID=349934 RepID=A0ABX0SM33_9ACTN|nr:MarR family transcriptional regulator [Brooklawnia cerclae]NIH57816.1 DNA-binding MarR family transcriptional regulator [Brooklawnia cerclae]
MDSDDHGPEPDRGDDLGALADLTVRIARKLAAHRFQDPEIMPLSDLDGMVLRHIDDHPGISPSQLAADLVLQTSNASASLRSLEAKGFLTRVPDPSDGRCVQLFPTDAARRSSERVRAEWGRLLDPLVPPEADVPATVVLLRALDSSLS